MSGKSNAPIYLGIIIIMCRGIWKGIKAQSIIIERGETSHEKLRARPKNQIAIGDMSQSDTIVYFTKLGDHLTLIAHFPTLSQELVHL